MVYAQNLAHALASLPDRETVVVVVDVRDAVSLGYDLTALILC